MIRVKVEIRRHQFDDENPITWTTGTELDTPSYKTYQVPDDRYIQVWIENKYSKPLKLKFVYFEDNRDDEDYGNTEMFYTRKPQVLYTLHQDNTCAEFGWKIYHEGNMILRLNFTQEDARVAMSSDKRMKMLLRDLKKMNTMSTLESKTVLHTDRI
jgi:hypothetical protein